MRNPVKDLLKRYSTTWALLAQTTAWVASAIVGFLLPPPAGTPEDSRMWVRFAQFIVTVVIGVLLLIALRWKRKKDVLAWAATSILFLLWGTATFFGYQIFAARWTATYNQQSVIIGGDSYTEHGREYHVEKPNLSPADLLMHFRGQAEKIWLRESLDQRRLLLAAMYVLAMPLFTVSLMSIVQAIQCAVAKSPTRKRSARG